MLQDLQLPIPPSLPLPPPAFLDDFSELYYIFHPEYLQLLLGKNQSDSPATVLHIPTHRITEFTAVTVLWPVNHQTKQICCSSHTVFFFFTLYLYADHNHLANDPGQGVSNLRRFETAGPTLWTSLFVINVQMRMFAILKIWKCSQIIIYVNSAK